MLDPTLAALGWTDELEAAFTTHSERGFEPARVVAEHRGGYYVRGTRGDRLSHARGKLRDDELWGGMPAVGDWVAVVDAPGDRAAIEAVLPGARSSRARRRGSRPRSTSSSRTSTRCSSSPGSTRTSTRAASSGT